MKITSLLSEREFFYNFNSSFEGHNISVTMPKNFFCEEMLYDGLVHNHLGYELHYVISGKLKAYIQEKELVLSKGEYAFIAPGVSHRITAFSTLRSSRCRVRINIDKCTEECHSSGNYQRSVLCDFLKKGNKSFYTGYSKDIYQCFKEIHYETINKGLFSNCIIKNNVNNIIIHILRNIYKSQPMKKSKTINIDDNRINIIDAYFINNFYKSEISKHELAEILCISVRQLERILLNYYGQTFMNKLIQMRIEQGKHLLINTENSIDNISYQLGFANVACFRRVFKSKTGFSPNNYRKIKSYKTDKNYYSQLG